MFYAIELFCKRKLQRTFKTIVEYLAYMTSGHKNCRGIFVIFPVQQSEKEIS